MNGPMKIGHLCFLKKRERAEDGAVLLALLSKKGRKRRVKVDDREWGSHSCASLILPCSI